MEHLLDPSHYPTFLKKNQTCWQKQLTKFRLSVCHVFQCVSRTKLNIQLKTFWKMCGRMHCGLMIISIDFGLSELMSPLAQIYTIDLNKHASCLVAHRAFIEVFHCSLSATIIIFPHDVQPAFSRFFLTVGHQGKMSQMLWIIAQVLSELLCRSSFIT